MEKYTSKDWAGLSRRARGPRNHRAARIKARMVQHIQSRTDLTPSAKLAGSLLVRWYNERVGYSWPPNSTLAAETGLAPRSINRATAELHELGIVNKVIGGGWDKGKIRHKANMYYPAFSLVLESAERPGNPPKYPDNLSSLPDCQGTNDENRRNPAEVPCQIVTPYSDNDMANANASPISPNGSTGSLAPPISNGSDPDLDKHPIEFKATVGGLSKHLGISVEELVAFLNSWRRNEVLESAIVAACSTSALAPARNSGTEHEWDGVIEVRFGDSFADLVDIRDDYELVEDSQIRIDYWN